MNLDRVVNIEDLRKLARRRAPLPIFDYVDGGAEGEVTLRDNRRVWEEILFRPRNATYIDQPDLRANVLGCDLSMPILLAPIGFTRLIHHEGEVAVAAAAVGAEAESVGFGTRQDPHELSDAALTVSPLLNASHAKLVAPSNATTASSSDRKILLIP